MGVEASNDRLYSPRFHEDAKAVLEQIRSGPVLDVSPDRTLAIVANALQRTYEAARQPPDGLSKQRLARLVAILEDSRVTAESNLAAESDASTAKAAFETGLIQAYKLIQRAIEKLERGDFG